MTKLDRIRSRLLRLERLANPFHGDEGFTKEEIEQLSGRPFDECEDEGTEDLEESLRRLLERA